MNEQAAALQDYINRKNLSRMIDTRQSDGKNTGTIITITSGKGGVGKSMLVLNLGLAVQKKTLLVDGDFLLGDLLTLADRRPVVGWEKVLTNQRTWSQAVQSLDRTTDVLSVRPLGSEKLIATHTSAAILSRLVRKWKQEYDLILIDTASGLGMRVIEWSLVANHLVMVSTPDPTSCMNTYAMAKSFSLSEEIRNLGLIINQYLQDENPWTIYRQMELMTQKLLDRSLNYCGAIPWMDDIAYSTRQQIPLLLRDEGLQWLHIFQEIISTIMNDTQNEANSFKVIG